MAHPRAAPPGRLRDRAPAEREQLAESIACRLDLPMTVLGVVFLLLVVAETVSRPEGGVDIAFQVLGWALWLAFAAEFALRLVVAPSAMGYLRRNWWQLLFLVVPFLRFTRVIRAVRAARLGRVVSSAVRSTRTARRRLSGRIAWLAATTLVVVLSGSVLLAETGEFATFGDALHAAAVATVAGDVVGARGGFARVVEVVLLGYSVVVFATLAGAVGAFLVERGGQVPERDDVSGDDGVSGDGGGGRSRSRR